MEPTAQTPGAGENPAASSFINSRVTPFIPSALVPLVPSKCVLQVTAPDWLLLFASPISRLSGSLRFGPHVEVASAPGVYAEVTAATY